MNPLLIIAAIEAATKLLEFISKARQQAARTKEWTPEEEAKVDANLEELKKKASWQIDPD